MTTVFTLNIIILSNIHFSSRFECRCYAGASNARFHAGPGGRVNNWLKDGSKVPRLNDIVDVRGVYYVISGVSKIMADVQDIDSQRIATIYKVR